jgi:hypothetical protein
MCVALAIAGAAAASAGAGIYESNQSAGISSQALGLAQNTQNEQAFYNNQLMQLMSNPSSFLTSPVFQAGLNQGLSGVSRQMAAQGYLGSGNEAQALETYGQSYAQQELTQQEQILGADAGIQSAPNPASALGAATGAQGQSANQLGGSLASLGFTLSNLQGGSGTSVAANNAMFGPGTPGSWGTGNWTQMGP